MGAAQEAVEIWRQLAEVDPGSYLSDLGAMLSNLGIWLGEAGQGEAALESTKEAVEIFHQMAELDPDAYLPSLISSLNDYSVRLTEIGRSAEVNEAWESAIAALHDDTSRHVLQVEQARWLLSRSEASRGVALLVKILAASPLSGRTETRVRTLLRGHWHSYPGDVENVWQEFQKTSAPTWLHLADDHINTVIAWISSSTWDESRQYLAEHSGLILDDMTSVVLDELALMAPAQLIDLHQNLLYSIREYGADAVYRQLVLAETADQWMAASDWDASRAFIEDHPELLSDSMTAIMGIKADTGDPTASVHNALLTLARGPLVLTALIKFCKIWPQHRQRRRAPS